MFVYLIAKPRKQDTNIKVQGHQGMREVVSHFRDRKGDTVKTFTVTIFF